MGWFPRRRQPGTGAAPLRIRPLCSDDAPAIDAVFAGLSARSRYLRFHTAVQALTPQMRAALLAVDGRTHTAFVAEGRDGRYWRAVGIGRFIRTAPAVAELAVAVVDAWHGRGVGRALLGALKARAEALGYAQLRAEVLLDNTPVVVLLHSVFPGARLQAAGETGTVICPLTPAPSAADRAADAWGDALAGGATAVSERSARESRFRRGSRRSAARWARTAERARVRDQADHVMGTRVRDLGSAHRCRSQESHRTIKPARATARPTPRRGSH